MIRTISQQELVERLEGEQPRNDQRSGGYALVNVLDHDAFAKAHIPGSVNIPAGHEEAFKERYDTSKEIILYCSSASCPASPRVARVLEAQGFGHVEHYRAGLEGWAESGYALESGTA
ncbi:MAG: rhodanese-like domain-containing protein [Vicinamibacterales bacterium]